jgi:membrane protein implicated in regulation of membrane protease activity
MLKKIFKRIGKVLYASIIIVFPAVFCYLFFRGGWQWIIATLAIYGFLYLILSYAYRHRNDDDDKNI